MITRPTVLYLSLSQLICWGISYYLIGVLGEFIAADTGWKLSIIYGGYSVALLMMGLTSPFVGHWIDRYGGRLVMFTGSCFSTLGCAGLALSQNVLTYYIAWILLGLAMRLTLYDAAFASLVRIGGMTAKRPISQITLLGGLASTVFWPIGHFLAEQFGWRWALVAYAGFALLTIPLHLAIPNNRHVDMQTTAETKKRSALAHSRRERFIAGSLFALIVMLTNFLNSGMSAHMINILSGLGIVASVSVWIATLRGIGQSSARLGEIIFGSRLHPLDLNMIATLVLPFSFIVGLLSGTFHISAICFALLYGAGNGIVTITRGTMPLVLFDHQTYGSFVGQLLVPSFLLSAAAPLIYALIIERFGESEALYLSVAVSFITLAASLLLKRRYGIREQKDVSSLSKSQAVE